MYGITEQIKDYVDDRINKNKTFLKNVTFRNDDYKLVSLFDSDMNANLNPHRYFAEVNNRVHTIFRVAKELNLYPVFVTITAPSAYHIKSKIYNGSTPKETALYLSQIWSKFRHLKLFKNIKNNTGHNMIYIRVYEPHKSGVPHLHAMLFLPKNYIKEVKVKFFEHFKKFDIKQLKYITNFSNAKYEDSLGAIAYILKYMNKTFMNAKDGFMSDEAYYFAYHGIRRFITSQTLVPLWLYRKIKFCEDNQNLYEVTQKFRQNLIYTQFNKTMVLERFVNCEFDEDKNVVNSFLDDKIIYSKNENISHQLRFLNDKKVYQKIPKKIKKRISSIPVYRNDRIIGHFHNFKFREFQKHITRYSDYELINLYYSYDVENSSYMFYSVVRNFMIDRGLLSGVKMDLTKIDDFLSFKL